MPIGRARHVIYDCPDPMALAGFYADLLGLPIAYASPDFVVLSRDDQTSGFAFQRPVGHPFCLIRHPGWTPPIGSDG